MTLPKTNFSPPFNITRASHTVVTSRNIEQSYKFYTEVIGLILTTEEKGTLYFRGAEESCHHSLVIKPTKDEPVCERIGFRVFTDEELDKAHRHFTSIGLKPSFVDVPHQSRTLHVSDISGTPIELCASMPVQPRMHMRLSIHKGAAARRMDHYQILVPNVLKAAEFYMSLGFRISDYIALEGKDDLIATFLYRKDNPWDIVFLPRQGPRMHHFGYVIESMTDMIRACDAAADIGFADNIEHGPGRHSGTHAYFTYLCDPDGHRVELLLPAIQLTDIEDEPVRWDFGPNFKGSAWGAPIPPSWIDSASIFAGVPPREMEGGDPFARAST
jgi:catechol 2,3-dioxygenase